MKWVLVVCLGLGLLTGIAFAQQKVLTIIMEDLPETDIIRALLPEFYAANPDLRVVIDSMPYEAMRDKIMTQFFAPVSGYDIIIVDNPWTDEFAAAGWLTPLDDFIEATPGYNYNDFISAVADIAVYQNTIYGVPFYNYAVALIVRQDIFDARGFPIPRTLKEYVETAIALTDKAAGFYGAAMQAQRGYKIFEECANYFYALGAEVIDAEGRVVIDSPQAKEALRLYCLMVEKAAQPGAVTHGFDEAMRLMAGGRAATMISYNWMLPTLNKPEISGKYAGKFAIYPVPGSKAVLGAWYWAIPHNAADKESAWRFIAWVSSPETQKKAAILGSAPVRISVLTDPEVWEKGFGKDYYLTVLEILKTAKPLARGPYAEQIIEIVGLELNNAASGLKTVEDALRDAADELKKLLGQ